MQLNRKAFKDEIPAIKSFLSALTTYFKRHNYLELFNAFLMGANTIAY
jgi:hypothetical protein